MATLKEKMKDAWVPDLSKSKHHVSPLSKTPGGAAVHVEYGNGEVRTYGNVKHPKGYILAIWREHEKNIRKGLIKYKSDRIKDIWTL